jgi:hypothetical protein
VAVVFPVLGTSPILDVVVLTLLALHDPVDATWRTILAVVLETTSQLPLLAFTVTLVDVAKGVAIAPVLSLGWLSSSWMVGSLLHLGRLDRLHECRLDLDAADLDAALYSSTRVVTASTSGKVLAYLRRANAAPSFAWGLLRVSKPASSNSRCRLWTHGGAAWRCSSTRRCARFALAWIRRASSESVASTRSWSFTETTRTRHQVDLWLLGEMRIRAF